MNDNQISNPLLITSVQNPKIKQLLELQQKSSARRQSGLFVVEGQREVQRCVNAGYELDTVFICPEYCNKSFAAPHAFAVSPYVYEKIAYRGTTEGVVATVVAKPYSLADLRLPENALIVVLERVEKPGNLGAILRSADAAAADAVIVCDPLTDLYNPNLIRASVGAFFSVPTVACTSEECIAFLQEHSFRILTAQLQDSRLYYNTDMRGATALVFGTESTGLTPQWREAADAHVRIPMLGAVDSLNVSVSVAILLFEAVRQRQAIQG